MYKKLKNKTGYTNAINSIGITLSIKGEPKKAIKYLKKSLKMQKTIGNNFYIVKTLAHLYSAYKIAGKTKACEKNYKEASKIVSLILKTNDKNKIDEMLDSISKSLKIDFIK